MTSKVTQVSRMNEAEIRNVRSKMHELVGTFCTASHVDVVVRDVCKTVNQMTDRVDLLQNLVDTLLEQHRDDPAPKLTALMEERMAKNDASLRLTLAMEYLARMGTLPTFTDDSKGDLHVDPHAKEYWKNECALKSQCALFLADVLMETATRMIPRAIYGGPEASPSPEAYETAEPQTAQPASKE